MQDVTIVVPGGEMPAALALPQDVSTPRPGVIVIHEIFGLNDDIRRIAQRFADEGYVALAPHLYHRGPRPLCVMRAMRDLRRGIGESFEDLDVAREWLALREEVDASRIGITGFCMGGGFALLYAVRAPVGATAPFYGDVPKGIDKLRGVAPVCASFGGLDRMFAAKAPMLERHLSELGVPHDVKVYSGAGHSFMSQHSIGPLQRVVAAGPMKVGFNAEAAEDAWRRVLDFFAEHLQEAELP
jgi:carboxymethylenebutenolidase